MLGAPVVLIVESDPQACEQMKRVLATMDTSVVEAGDLSTVSSVAAHLVRNGTPPDVIVSRVTLPDGSGIQALDEMADLFPRAHQVLVSHFPKSLLLSLPGFADRRAEFLQAAFSDDQFRKVVERCIGRRFA